MGIYRKTTGVAMGGHTAHSGKGRAEWAAGPSHGPMRPGALTAEPRSPSAGRPQRQPDPNDGVPGPRVDVDLPAVTLHDDSAGQVEPEPGALADLLGREERLEGVGGDLLGHTVAGIPDLDDDGAVIGVRPDRERPLALHGVDRVVDEVGPHLVELAGRGLDKGYVVGVLAPHR